MRHPAEICALITRVIAEELPNSEAVETTWQPDFASGKNIFAASSSTPIKLPCVAPFSARIATESACIKKQRSDDFKPSDRLA
ncbi:hypothetical protein DN068_08215 [Taibaiella soli]|uniref:Uncharacterized protein n=1 Tax=Taibaiella soli TaxID=1649169 RepID=A0A2W2AD41_9BACT|nr:hypothetical protein DN068_08215 [Taibaiella soli]